RIASVAADGTVRIWDADGSGELLVLRGAWGAEFNSARWSPDGTRILAASDDLTVWIFRDLEPLRGTDDPRLWAATAYCPPVAVPRRPLEGPDEGAPADLERCLRLVRQAGPRR